MYLRMYVYARRTEFPKLYIQTKVDSYSHIYHLTPILAQ